jgi:hypothetical protein
MKIDRIRLANAFADSAFLLFKVKTAFMDVGYKGNGLRKVNMNRFIRRQILIVWIRDFDRAVLHTGRTTRASVFYDVSGFFIQGDLEVSCLPGYTVNFRICQNLYIGMPADLDQFG